MTTIETPGFLSFTVAILVFFAGAGLNRLIPPLGRWTIPEAVTGGLLAALATLALHEAFGLEVRFDLAARDTLLLYFFTGIGLNARLSDLQAGGRPLLILLAVTLLFCLFRTWLRR
jgi:ESS family glutamate:Na+ symporter